jgi:NADH-quinone oxidoreductase subunit C
MANDPSEKTPAPKPPADSPKPAAEGAAIPPKAPVESAEVPPKPAAPAAPSAPAKAAVPPKAAAPAAPAKPAAPGAPAAAAPPKPPAAPPPPKEGPTPLDNELVQRLKARFGDGIKEATQDRKQAIVLVEAGKLREISRYCRDEEKFDMLDDLTAVDWPKREKRFDIVVILYSFPKNERLRLKAQAAENEPVPSLCEIWPVANWLERECYDMFGIVFEGHPDLKRILMPDEWQGFPLRKDYDILKQDTAWVRENLGIESGQ